MFLCSLINELCTKEKSSKTGWSLNCFYQYIFRTPSERICTKGRKDGMSLIILLSNQSSDINKILQLSVVRRSTWILNFKHRFWLKYISAHAQLSVWERVVFHKSDKHIFIFGKKKKKNHSFRNEYVHILIFVYFIFISVRTMSSMHIMFKMKNLECLHSTFRTFDSFQAFTQV